MFVPGRLLLAHLKGYNGASWIKNLPQDVRIGGGNTEPSRDGVIFTIHSGTFPPVDDGEVIPELTALEWS